MATQRRSGGVIKVTTPNVKEFGVRKSVLRSIEHIFNEPLVDRMFEDGSIPSSKLSGGGGSTLLIIETSTSNTTMSNNADVHICNGTIDYQVTLPTGITGKLIRIINKNTAIITLSGSINSTTATDTLLSGESIELIYDGSEWL